MLSFSRNSFNILCLTLLRSKLMRLLLFAQKFYTFQILIRVQGLAFYVWLKFLALLLHQLWTKTFILISRSESFKHCFSTPIALNLLDLQSHLFKWAQLHYLLGIKASYLFPLLEHSVWSSHPWLCSAIHKILKRHPDIDFQDLLFKLANTHLFVPQTFPCNQILLSFHPKALPAPSNSSLLSNTTSSPSDTLKFIRDMHSTSILSTSKSE